MKNNENSHFIDKVIDTLRKAADEMEEFQVKVEMIYKPQLLRLRTNLGILLFNLLITDNYFWKRSD